MNTRLTLLSLFLASLFFVPTTLAAEPTPAGCQPIFNGGNVCSNSNTLTINKKILRPGVTVRPGQSFNDADFIENIGPNDTRYTANTATAFRIYITNKTRSTLKNIEVKDIFPPRFITFVSGNGSYDNTTRTFSTTIGELKGQETKVLTIQVMTASTSDLPKDNSSLCTINLALATVNNKTSQDTSQLCVANQAAPKGQTTAFAAPTPIKSGQTTKGGFPQVLPTATPVPTNPPATKGGLPVVSPVTPQPGQNTPSTGPESLVLAGLLPTGFLGWLLRKKA